VRQSRQVGITVVFSFVDGKLLVVFDDLPLTDERSVLHTEINLVSQSTRGIEDGYDCGVDDLTAVHVDADFVAALRGCGAGLGFFGTA
jgi:hypothetical protein